MADETPAGRSFRTNLNTKLLSTPVDVEISTVRSRFLQFGYRSFRTTPSRHAISFRAGLIAIVVVLAFAVTLAFAMHYRAWYLFRFRPVSPLFQACFSLVATALKQRN